MEKENIGVARSVVHIKFDRIDESSHLGEHVRELAANSVESAAV